MIKVCSFNCNSLKNSLVEIAQLCATHDVVFIQETWLSKFELHMLNSIHRDFLGLGVSALDSSSGLLTGRPFGGIAILWRKSLQCSVQVKSINDRMMEIDIETNMGTMCLLNVYLPTDYRDTESHDQFCMSLGQLAYNVDVLLSRTNLIAIIGDFNANSFGSSFFAELTEFCNDNGLVLSDVTHLGSSSNTYTYVSAAHGTVSWLDHCICSPALHSYIHLISVKYDLCLTDHMPLMAEFILQSAASAPLEPEVSFTPKILWESITAEQVHQYNHSVRSKLRTLNSVIDVLATVCANDCFVDSHIHMLSLCCEALMGAIMSSSESCFGSKGQSRRQADIVPKWNDSVKAKYQIARMAFVTWRSCGSPKEGLSAIQMRQTRLSFKYALRKCKRERDIFNVNKLALSLLKKEQSGFWSLVKQQLGGRTPLPPSFGGVTGSVSIANMWANHFKSLFNDSSCSSDSGFLDSIISEQSPDIPPITTEEVCSAVSKMKSGKAPGWDNMSSEHLRYLEPDNLSVIAVLFSSALHHGNIPDCLIYSLLTPLVKDKNGMLDDTSNYRAIALSTTLSKVLELILVDRLQPFLCTNDSQFGFKADHSTTHATFVLKETINYFTSRGSPVYACFLDASKAFDRVTHSKLFETLKERGVPLPYLKLLLKWYRSQMMAVKWANSTSYSFPVGNGVRQGGNLSPLLFNVYIDDLLRTLRACSIGCRVGSCVVNVLAYADDIVILSPSRAGLQELVNRCESFAVSKDIRFNVKKTVCMVFNPQRSNAHLLMSKPPDITLLGKKLTWVEEFRYLGHVINSSLRDNSDMRRLKRSLYYCVNMLRATVGKANKGILVKLFKSFCTNMYGCELWDPSRERKAFRELCVAYHSCVKRLVGVPISFRNHPLCLSINILPCPMLVASRQLLFWKRLGSSENMLIKTLLGSDIARNGMSAKVHQTNRREYALMDLDLSSTSRADIMNVFTSHLKRLVTQPQPP